MKVFVFSSKDTSQTSEIVDLLTKYKVTVFINQRTRHNQASVVHIDDLAEEKHKFLPKMDAVVIIGNSNGGVDAGFVSALALFYQKPILILLSGRGEFPEELSLLTMDSQISKYVRVHYRQENKIPLIVKRFLNSQNRFLPHNERASVKFTLRVTPSLYHYLHQKACMKKITKAVFLRDLILKDLAGSGGDSL